MKKLTHLLFVFVLGTNLVNANPVNLSTAQQVAENYFTKISQSVVSTITLAYTEVSGTGLPIYYVFDINTDGGFIIVTADDAAHPIIGYSTKKHFVQPAAITTIAYWLNRKRDEINSIRINNYPPDAAITNEWADYLSTEKDLSAPVNTMTVSNLVQSTWNQSPYYNDDCPGGSITGCVATTMAQIMRFWNYPANGLSSSSYNSNYGMLSCNYGTATYNWANMPLNVSSANADVALINYHCGVSVEMDYSPNGSGAMVLEYSPGAASAEYSFKTYFAYDPSTLQGLEKVNYTAIQWQNLLENDLNIGRPIQYAGYGQGGHTWVCDGYDANHNFHMNWGWGGYDDGYFSLTALNPGSSSFTNDQQAIIGIQPLGATLDAGTLAVNSPSGTSCNTSIDPIVKIKNYGLTLLNSCVINYQVDNNPVQLQNWTGSLSSGQTADVALPTMTVAAGAHTLTCYTTNPNSNSDGNNLNDQTVVSFTINSVTAPTTTDGSSCSTSTGIPLSAAGGGTLNWYSAPTGGVSLNSGTTYTTPPLTSTTTYYVESEIAGAIGNVGPATTTAFGAGGNHNNTSTQYLTFDVLQACTLQTALVKSGSAGTRNVIVWDNTGTQLQSVPVNFPSGTGTVTLNIALTPGSYRIGGTGMDLWRNNTGGAYPYNLSGVINITGSSAGANYYYYLFNWQVENAPCLSPRTPVIANIVSGPAVNYSAASYDSVLLSTSAFPLTGGTPAGGTYSGTGVNAGSFDPAVSGIGKFTITYTYIDNNGCSNSATQDVYVSSSTLGISTIDVKSGIVLYPNPTTGNFTLEMVCLHDEEAVVELVNVIGQSIFTERHNFVSGSNKLPLNLNGEAKGIYFVQVKTLSGIITKRIVMK